MLREQRVPHDLSKLLWAADLREQQIQPVEVLLRHFPAVDEGDDRLHGVRVANGFQGEGELLRIAAEGELAGLELGHPVRLEFADREPEGVVERAVHRLVEDVEGILNQCGGIFLIASGDCSHGFEPDTRIRVVEEIEGRLNIAVLTQPSLTVHSRSRSSNSRFSLISSGQRGK